jgi:hypothetical protein
VALPLQLLMRDEQVLLASFAQGHGGIGQESRSVVDLEQAWCYLDPAPGLTYRHGCPAG